MSKKKNEMDPDFLAAANAAATSEEVASASPDLTRKIGVWKKAVVEKARAEGEETVTKALVFAGMVATGAHAITSKYGTITICKNAPREPAPIVNWEAVARAGIKPDLLAELVAKHTTMSEPSDTTPFIKAVSGWSAEAGKKAA